MRRQLALIYTLVAECDTDQTTHIANNCSEDMYLYFLHKTAQGLYHVGTSCFPPPPFGLQHTRSPSSVKPDSSASRDSKRLPTLSVTPRHETGIILIAPLTI